MSLSLSGQKMLTNECRPTVRFGPYEADFEKGVLRKFGLPVKLQGKPLAVLWVLVENAGEIVSREQLQRSLWPDNTFVDFDKNLSTAVNKLRDALCDNAIDAQYIETIPRKGYRFRAHVERVTTVEPKDAAPSAPTASAPETPALPIPQKRGFWASAVVLSAAVIIVSVGALYSVNRRGGSLSEKDTVVLADFDNSTGDAVFDDALKTALAVSLRQSPFLNVLPESRVGSTLQLMLRPGGARLTPEVARELCIRAGSSAYLAGAIGSL
jgi:DNA-binding winged helix-turn-helix (wHTH) protein